MEGRRAWLPCRIDGNHCLRLGCLVVLMTIIDSVDESIFAFQCTHQLMEGSWPWLFVSFPLHALRRRERCAVAGVRGQSLTPSVDEKGLGLGHRLPLARGPYLDGLQRQVLNDNH